MAERGYQPPTPVTLMTNRWEQTSAGSEHVSSYAQYIHARWRATCEALLEAEAAMRAKTKARMDARRGKPHYKEGDEVLMHWPSFRPYSDIFRKHRLRYVGPFRVVKAIGANAVELEGLPERMPKVINAEYLHKYVKDTSPVLESLRSAPQPPQPRREIRMMTPASSSLGGAVC